MRAFTLIEMLVTVSIIAIMTTFTVVNLGFQRENRKVQQVTREFYGAVSYARNLTVTGKTFKDEDGDGKPDVPNGYGVHFSVIMSGGDFFYRQQIYGDLYTSASSKQYDAGSEEFGAGETLNVTDFLVSLYFDGISAGPLGLPQTIFFTTPRGEITYYQNLTDVSLLVPPITEVGFEFASKKNPSVKKRVIINRVSNQIYVSENP